MYRRYCRKFILFVSLGRLQSPLAGDSVVLVRVAYAENIALLAETALRFLEIVQLSNHSNDRETVSSSSGQDVSQYKVGAEENQK